MKRNMIILMTTTFGIIFLSTINSCSEDTPDCPETFVWDSTKGECVKKGTKGVY